MSWLKDWIYGKTPWKVEPEPKPEPKSELDDWVPGHGEWEEITICHCGKQQYCGGIVCPQCGHKDKWVKRVQRQIWEESPSRPCIIYRRYSNGGFCDMTSGHERRNHGVEVWDESKCGVKDE